MNDSNAGLGMAPCKPNCRCDECTIERQRVEIELANSRERTAYEAGLLKGWELQNESYPSIDIEQHWQQYRCQDPTAFRSVTTKDNA